MRRIGPALAATLALTLAAGLTASCGTDEAARRIEIRIHYSAFDPATIRVPHGMPITFVLVNTDPIEHEWLLGDEAFHARHRTGRELQHGERPNEVSVPPLSTVTTTLRFDEPIRLRYICHLPRHEAYGMVGTLIVT